MKLADDISKIALPKKWIAIIFQHLHFVGLDSVIKGVDSWLLEN